MTQFFMKFSLVDAESKKSILPLSPHPRDRTATNRHPTDSVYASADGKPARLEDAVPASESTDRVGLFPNEARWT